MQRDSDVVEELAVEVDGAARAGVVVCGSGGLDEPMQHRQAACNAQVLHHQPKILRRSRRRESWRTVRVARRIGGADVVADHLAAARDVRRNERAVHTVARRAVAMRSIIEHRDGNFAVVHHAIAHRQVGHGIKRDDPARRDRHDLVRRRLERRMGDIENQRSKVGRARAVHLPRRRSDEVNALVRVDGGRHAEEFWGDEEIRVIAAHIQPVDAQHVGAAGEETYVGG